MPAPLVPAIALGAAAAAFAASLAQHNPKMAGSIWSNDETENDRIKRARTDALSLLARVYEANEAHPGRSLGRHQMRVNGEDQITRWQVGVDDSSLHLTLALGFAKVKLSVPLAEVTMVAVEAQVSRGAVRPDVELHFHKGFKVHLVTSAASAELIMQASLGAVKAHPAKGFNTVGHHTNRGW